jgi:hypothetical protein
VNVVHAVGMEPVVGVVLAQGAVPQPGMTQAHVKLEQLLAQHGRVRYPDQFGLVWLLHFSASIQG